MFTNHSFQRTATTGEMADIQARHLSVLADIDSTEEEKKATAKEFADLLKAHHAKEKALRANLTSGTVSVDVEVEAFADHDDGVMRYRDRDGYLVPELERTLTDAERQLPLFTDDGQTGDTEPPYDPATELGEPTNKRPRKRVNLNGAAQ